jgi:hypothetical protein
VRDPVAHLVDVESVRGDAGRLVGARDRLKSVKSGYERTQRRLRVLILVLLLLSLPFLFIALTGPSVIRPVFWVYFGLVLAMAVAPLRLVVSNKKVESLGPDPLPEGSSGRASLRIFRSREQWRATGRVYKVIIDGKAIGGLSNGESKLFDVLPGTHRVRMGVAWTGSKEVEITLQDGETRAVSCRPSRSAPMFIRIFRRDGSVDLYEENADVVLPWSPEPPQ